MNKESFQLTTAKKDDILIVDRMEVTPKERRRLNDIGLLKKSTIRVVNKLGKSPIIQVKHTVMAIEKSLASKIFCYYKEQDTEDKKEL
ncbi:MAG: ferrous iron transport protein A [Clostridia bacterium]|nr:ferrous iron transport protein A [Clostridia bacterium]